MRRLWFAWREPLLPSMFDGPLLCLLGARIAGLRRPAPFGLESARFVGRLAGRRRPRLSPARGDRLPIATDIRRRCIPWVGLGPRVSLRRRHRTRLLLILLADHGLARLVGVVPVPQGHLLIDAGITIP